MGKSRSSSPKPKVPDGWCPVKIHLPYETIVALKVEALQRNVVLGEIVQEGLLSRITFMDHASKERKK